GSWDCGNKRIDGALPLHRPQYSLSENAASRDFSKKRPGQHAQRCRRIVPRPALENLATFSPRVIAFVIAMVAGMVLYDFWQQHRLTIRYEGTLAAAADG